MTEISCGECGALNPAQSKFCNRCGAPLRSETTQLCPNCNTPNPINLLYCDNCGTRLVDDSDTKSDLDDEANVLPSSRSEPFSLPARPPGQTGNLDVSGELPDWLVTGDFGEADLGDEFDSDELRWLRAAREGRSWDDADAPSLEELSGDHAPKDDLPTWLMDDDAGDAIFSADKSTDELFLESLQSRASEPEEDSAQHSEAVSALERWLTEMEAEESDQTPSDVDEQQERSAGEIAPFEPEPMSGREDGGEDEDTFLQWLSAVEDQEHEGAGAVEDRGSESVHEFEEVAAWLAEGAQHAGTAQDGPAADEANEIEIPDALKNDPDRADRPLEVDGAPDEDPVLEDVQDEALPEDEFLQWLDSLDEAHTELPGEQEPEAASDPVEPDVSSLEAHGFDADDFRLPDWLGELTERQPDSEPELTDLDELPNWLQDLASPGEELTLPYVSSATVELEPGTRQDDDRDTVESGDASEGDGAARVQAPDEAALLEGELPDWLSGVTPELGSAGPSAEVQRDDAAPGADLPMAEESAWTQVSDRDRVDLGLGDQPVAAEDLPDWFSDVLADIETLEEAAADSESKPALPNVPEQLAGSELPEWLDSPFSEEPVAEPTPMEEIPEWLRASLREQLAHAAEERGIDDLALDSGGEWRELLEWSASAEHAAAGKAGRVDADAWLEALRAGAQAEFVGESESDEGLSPVAGIPGAIDVAYNVKQPSRRRQAIEDAASTEQEQQALLLRQLSRAQDAETAVALTSASTTAALPTLVRLVASVILLGIIVLGLSGNRFVAGVMPPLAAEPTAAPLETFLGGAAGEPVLLIFDYSPAMSGALQPVARHVLRQLAEQSSPTLIASQSAAGLALAANAVDSISSGAAADLGLITGGALGIRQIARCMAQEAPCQSLFGQPVSTEAGGQLASVASVILVTGDREHLVAWIEQLESAGIQSLGAIVTPALEPVASPYLASGQLEDAAVALGEASVSDAPLRQRMSAAQALSTWFTVLAIAAGSLFYLVTDWLNSRRK